MYTIVFKIFGKDVVYSEFPIGNNKIYHRYFCNLISKSLKNSLQYYNCKLVKYFHFSKKIVVNKFGGITKVNYICYIKTS